jgi:SLT domain-containing protein
MPMPDSFKYWTELRSFLAASYPTALMGSPQVSLVPSTMYKTAANWADPSGKNWTIYPWGYAGGGLVTKPTWAPIAERGPEYIVPQGKLEQLLAAILQAIERQGMNRNNQTIAVQVEAGAGSMLDIAARGVRLRSG